MSSARSRSSTARRRPRRAKTSDLSSGPRGSASIIVEWHEAETSLRESERRFSTAFYSSPAGMAISRYADGRFMYMNDRFTTVFGYSRSEAIGKTSLELGLWADPGERAALWREVVERGGVHNAETERGRRPA